MPIEKDDMFYGATPEIFRRAKELRKNMTNAEKTLWAELRNKNIENYKFRRQHPINLFIADFYCHEARLVIEVDGGIHLSSDQHKKDIGRTHELESFGIQVVRFTNSQIEETIAEVIDKVKDVLKKRMIAQPTAPNLP